MIAVGGVVTLDGAIVRDNHTSTSGGGITAAESGEIFFDNCTIRDNPNATDGTGASAQNGGVVSIANSLIDGVRSGATATNNSRLIIQTSDVTGDLTSLATSRSEAIVDTTSLSGRLSIASKSRVQLVDVLQSSVGASAVVSRDSYFEVFATGPGTAAFTAPVTITSFSEGQRFGEVSYDQIFCSGAGELECDGLESKAGSTCGLCP